MATHNSLMARAGLQRRCAGPCTPSHRAESHGARLFEKALLQEEFDFFLARNGQEALDASREMELDAVLMDYSMPVMDGEAALVAMRATASTAQLPGVIITGETDSAVWKRCEAAGAL